MLVKKLTVLALMTSIIFSLSLKGYTIEINSPLAPIAPPKIAPLPKSDYAPLKTNRNFESHKTIPSKPSFKLNKGPDINHQQWCKSRFQAYRSSDNTYVDHGGVRQACNSPFSQ
ncbi:BA14K family protein [Bartonella tamiae]|uniref:Lectin-like protein BA14k n=1 Tax=Bartonella tamiae Th239 TaxID=1094558 RepID=J1JVP7_9HYPH|nr:BA14K family protein [Bartonella tamiae]EJF89037.1 hypothetical protein ME5_01588 [Bartonella tamiae Th239]EJF94713.1 hypothetical protein MEG_00294 [Bartonella tamiae Th307]